MSIFKEMAAKGHHQLLSHPLSQTFLAMKWMAIRRHFDIMLIVYALLAISFTFHCYIFTDLKERNWDKCNANVTCQQLEKDPNIILKEGNICKDQSW